MYMFRDLRQQHLLHHSTGNQDIGPKPFLNGILYDGCGCGCEGGWCQTKATKPIGAEQQQQQPRPMTKCWRARAWAAHADPQSAGWNAVPLNTGQQLRLDNYNGDAFEVPSDSLAINSGLDDFDHGDDDFDLVDSDQPIPPQANGNTYSSTGSLRTLAAASRAHLARHYSNYRARREDASTDDQEWDNVSGAGDTDGGRRRERLS